MKTNSIKKIQTFNKHSTYVLDATNVRIGKLLVIVAKILLGKYDVKAVRYMPFSDKVVIYNVEKLSVPEARKEKPYYRHSGYMGGLKKQTLGKLFTNNPEYLLKKGIWGMLPQNRYGRDLLANVRIHVGTVSIPNAKTFEIK